MGASCEAIASDEDEELEVRRRAFVAGVRSRGLYRRVRARAKGGTQPRASIRITQLSRERERDRKTRFQIKREVFKMCPAAMSKRHHLDVCEGGTPPSLSLSLERERETGVRELPKVRQLPWRRRGGLGARTSAQLEQGFAIEESTRLVFESVS